MGKIVTYILLLLLFFQYNLSAQEEFGKINLTPYVSDLAGVDDGGKKLLEKKLNQIVLANGVSGGFDRRFIITPQVQILSESTTGTIPQKTSVKALFSLYIGDGVSGSLFCTTDIESRGVGNDIQAALFSAIRKINSKDSRIVEMISQSKQRIISFYNRESPLLIKKAEAEMSKQNFENALEILSVIPALCSNYDNAQDLIKKCGNNIIDRDNSALLTKAKSAWSANPNQEGATLASKYLADIIVNSKSVKAEIDKLSNEIKSRLREIDNNAINLRKTEILSRERIEIENIRAAEKKTSAFYGMLPKLAYNIIRWL